MISISDCTIKYKTCGHGVWSSALRVAEDSARIARVMKNYLWKYFLPGVLLILGAFWVGTLPGMVFSFLGFISFFLAGVALIIEGRKKRN